MKAERGGEARPSHRMVLAVALPIIVSNVTQPLIGVADTAVLGRLGEPVLIGAVALGATVFSVLFWAFGFLRMGTAGLAAQADGAKDAGEVASVLARALLIAGLAGGALIVLQWPIRLLAFELLQGSAAVEAELGRYYAIRIWSAPAALANFAMLGWLIGLRRSDLSLVLQLFLNLTNIALDVVLVLGLGLGIAGVAMGTVIAEFAAAALGLLIVRRVLTGRGAGLNWRRILDRGRLVRTLKVNTDIMIRTLLLVLSFSFFMSESARGGDLVLAANAVLFQFLMVTAYLLDGFAFTAEALVGNAIGARARASFFKAVKLTTIWAFVVSVALALAIGVAGPTAIDFLTTSPEVRALARNFLGWAVASPLLGFACFQLDGIYIGATRTRDMRNMMILSTALYLAAWALLVPAYGNHGLWAALMVYFVARALTLGARFPALVKAAFAAQPSATPPPAPAHT